jgi:hypothetical protein
MMLNAYARGFWIVYVYICDEMIEFHGYETLTTNFTGSEVNNHVNLQYF